MGTNLPFNHSVTSATRDRGATKSAPSYHRRLGKRSLSWRASFSFNTRR